MEGSAKTMKKFLCILVAMCVGLAGISGCTGYNPETSDTSTSISSLDSDVSKDTDKSNWVIKHYVDEFKDPTSEMYLNYICSGTFSNTATTNSKLTTSIIIDSCGVSIKLYEYGSNVVQNPYSHKVKYDITTKDDFGNKSSLSGSMDSETGDRIFLTSKDGENLISRLKTAKSKEIRFHVVNSERPSTYYDFTVNTLGFSEAYDKLNTYNIQSTNVSSITISCSEELKMTENQSKQCAITISFSNAPKGPYNPYDYIELVSENENIVTITPKSEQISGNSKAYCYVNGISGGKTTVYARNIDGTIISNKLEVEIQTREEYEQSWAEYWAEQSSLD